MAISKNSMLDSAGRPLTQSLFLELGYSDLSVYTLKDQDYNYKGKELPSLKRIFLEHEDPTEYDFAVTHLLGWKHWQRLCDNKAIIKHISQWREELELKVRSQAVRDIMDMSADGSYQASKYLADKGWDKAAVGRPNKAAKAREDKMNSLMNDDFAGEVTRMENYRN